MRIVRLISTAALQASTASVHDCNDGRLRVVQRIRHVPPSNVIALSIDVIVYEVKFMKCKLEQSLHHMIIREKHDLWT